MDLVGLQAHRVAGNGGAAPREDTMAGPPAVHPPVPWAGEPRPGALALAEGTAPVGAHVAARVHRAAHPGQDDPGAVELHQLWLTGRHLVERGHPPGGAHASSLRTNARCRPVMYGQRISFASRTASAASPCFSSSQPSP